MKSLLNFSQHLNASDFLVMRDVVIHIISICLLVNESIVKAYTSKLSKLKSHCVNLDFNLNLSKLKLFMLIKYLK